MEIDLFGEQKEKRFFDFHNSFSDHFESFQLEHQQENLTFYKMQTNLTSIIITTLMTPNLNDNCTQFYSKVRVDYEDSIYLINLINYFIITIGIVFNILNLIVLLNSKLNESPYTYLTVLALSDLGALAMLAVEKIRQSLIQSEHKDFNIYIEYSFIYVITPLMNTFLSCSMYVTLALTIERFIFVHSPFRAMSICHRSIARRVCFGVFLFSFIRSLYLPFMYEKQKCVAGGFVQHKNKAIDIYEFIISLAIPYIIIFIVNISLIFSLNKQSSLMSMTRNQSFLFNNNNNNNQKTNSSPNIPDTLLANRVRRSSSVSFKTVLNNLETQRFFEEKETNQKVPKKVERQISNESEPAKRAESPIPTNLINNIIIKPTNKLYHRTSSNKEIKNQKKLTTSLIMILCSLLICYAPSFLFEESFANALFGESNYEDQSDESARLFKLKGIGIRISLVCIYINCSVNFLIYCISNNKFKNSLKSLIERSYLYNYFKTKRNCFNTKEQIGSIKYSLKQNENRNWHELIILNRTLNMKSSRNTSVSTRLTNSLRSSCENNLTPNI
jgi:hypothetical protein